MMRSPHGEHRKGLLEHKETKINWTASNHGIRGENKKKLNFAKCQKIAFFEGDELTLSVSLFVKIVGCHGTDNSILNDMKQRFEQWKWT